MITNILGDKRSYFFFEIGIRWLKRTFQEIAFGNLKYDQKKEKKLNNVWKMS